MAVLIKRIRAGHEWLKWGNRDGPGQDLLEVFAYSFVEFGMKSDNDGKPLEYLMFRVGQLYRLFLLWKYYINAM